MPYDTVAEILNSTRTQETTIYDIELLLKAVSFAADRHRDQRRKDTTATPYINHPIRVAETLAAIGKISDVTVLCAALLHDTVEDTLTTPAEIEQHFGAETRAIVAEVTDDKTLTKETRKQQQIEHAAHASVRAKLVKLGDKICNVADVTHNPPTGWSRARRLEYLEWSERVVAGCRGTNAALEEHFDERMAAARLALASEAGQ